MYLFRYQSDYYLKRLCIYSANHQCQHIGSDIYVWVWRATYPEYQMRFCFSVVDCSFNIYRFFKCNITIDLCMFVFVILCATLSLFLCARVCVWSCRRQHTKHVFSTTNILHLGLRYGLICMTMTVCLCAKNFLTVCMQKNCVIYSGWLHTRMRYQPKFWCRSRFYPSLLQFSLHTIKER